MEEKLTSEDTLLRWLKRDSRFSRFPIELSREYIPNPEGNDKLVIRLKYDDGSFINFPYNPKLYDSAWKFFNKYWKVKEQIASGEIDGRK